MIRGNELQVHRDAKPSCGRWFDDPAWSVFYEQRNADILVMHLASRFVAAIEVESSPRNVLRNIERNVAYGCHAVAVVSLSERYLGQITSKILGRAQLQSKAHLKLFSYNAQSLRELRLWIENLARSHGSNMEAVQ